MESRIMARTRWFTTGLAILAMIFALACAGDDTTSQVSGDAAPADQQVLRLRLNGEPKTIDPHLSDSVSEFSLEKPLFAGLFTFDENLKVIPNLASEIPTLDNGGISRDGTTYTVKLDKNAKWSDGKEVTASDFVYSMKRALDPKVASPYASFYYDLNGAKAYNTALGTPDAPLSPSDSDLSRMREGLGVSAKDVSTVVYQLTQPSPSFLSLLALWTAYPVRQDVVEKHGERWTEPGNLVGNGPFVLREWAHDQNIVFEANPFWHGAKPKLNRIVVNFITDDNAAYAAYLNDELDVVTVPPPYMREVTTPGSALSGQVVRAPELATSAIFFNNGAAPFDNMKVRQALAMAVDRVGLANGVLQGAGLPTTSWIPPGMPGYDASIGKQWEYNPTKAKQLLSEAGYSNPKSLSINLLAMAIDSERIKAQFIEEELEKNLGIDVTTDYVDPRTAIMRFATKQYQAMSFGWSADWPYPDNWLPELFSTKGGANHAQYKNAEFDKLVAQAAGESDDKKRLEFYGKAHKLMVDEAAVSPLYNRAQLTLVKPKVKDLIITALDGGLKGDYNFSKTFIAK